MGWLRARGACVCALAAALCALPAAYIMLLQRSTQTHSLYWRIYLFAPAADLCSTPRANPNLLQIE